MCSTFIRRHSCCVCCIDTQATLAALAGAVDVVRGAMTLHPGTSSVVEAGQMVLEAIKKPQSAAASTCTSAASASVVAVAGAAGAAGAADEVALPKYTFTGAKAKGFD